MAGLVPAIHVFLAQLAAKTWMPGTQASGSDAVLWTAMPGHDEKRIVFTGWKPPENA
jgi:hypothetical protein